MDKLFHLTLYRSMWLLIHAGTFSNYLFKVGVFSSQAAWHFMIEMDFAERKNRQRLFSTIFLIGFYLGKWNVYVKWVFCMVLVFLIIDPSLYCQQRISFFSSSSSLTAVEVKAWTSSCNPEYKANMIISPCSRLTAAIGHSHWRYWGWLEDSIYASPSYITIGSDNGLSLARRQTIICTNDVLLLIGPLRTNFNETWIGTQRFSFRKMCLKMSSWKWCTFCLDLIVSVRLGSFYWYGLSLFPAWIINCIH